MLLGERTGKRYRLADRIKVKLVRVDLETRKIDLVPADGRRAANAERRGERPGARHLRLPHRARAPARGAEVGAGSVPRRGAQGRAREGFRRAGRARGRAPDARARERAWTAWPAAAGTRAWSRASQANTQKQTLEELLESLTGAAAAAGAGRHHRSAQPRRLPARGECRRRARGDRAQGPRRRHQCHGLQGGERRGRNHALLHGDESRAHAGRPEGPEYLDGWHG